MIYVHTPEAARIDLIAVYGKDEKDDLSAREMRVLCVLAREVRREALDVFRFRQPRE